MCKCMFKIFNPERYDRVNPQCIIIYDKTLVNVNVSLRLRVEA